MTLSLIAAMDRNGLIGAKSGLPWQMPADLAYFRQQTLNKPIIMGSTTWSAFSRPLPNRHNIVLSRGMPLDTEGYSVARSLEDALEMVEHADEAFIIGGASVYEQAMPHVDRLYLTYIDGEFSGDTYFPEYNKELWREISREHHTKDEENPYNYSFVVYERK